MCFIFINASKVQFYFLKLVSKHILPILKNLHWLPMQTANHIQTLMLTVKTLNYNQYSSIFKSYSKALQLTPSPPFPFQETFTCCNSRLWSKGFLCSRFKEQLACRNVIRQSNTAKGVKLIHLFLNKLFNSLSIVF